MTTTSSQPAIQPRKTVQQMTAYKPPLEDRRGKIRLDFNENTTGFPQAYQGLDSEFMTTYPEYQVFTRQLADYFGVPEDWILLTNGSDEGLFVIPFTFIEPGQDTTVISSPTFALIPHYLELVQSNITAVPTLSDLSFDTEGTENALKNGAKLAIFASPDNPTGSVLPIDQVENWCKQFPNTLFVMDEAYAGYVDQTALPLVHRYPNLMVTRSFSKVWGMAGLRLGVVVAHPKLVDAMKRVRSPYSVNALSISIGTDLLSQAEAVKTSAKETMKRKADTVSRLQEMGYQIVAGHANFFLLKMGIFAKTFSQYGFEQGVLIRDRSSMPKLEGMVRVSVGTEAEMNKFLEVLTSFRQSQVLLFDMDGTLIDTSKSFDATVAYLVDHYSGKPLEPNELDNLRAEGGFNDDWDSTVELLRRRGVTKTYQDIEPLALKTYLSLASDHESWLLDPTLLTRLGKKYTLAVATGRFRPEYDPVWKEEMDPLFTQVFCQSDVPEAKRKPAPDLLQAAMTSVNATGGIYVGNSVDDMTAAQGAGLIPVGVTTTHDAETLKNAGAQIVLNHLSELENLLC
ncbi:MAG: aminotransferase class I/II-fold pyridoxal phosphate-dependent enzyme [Vampirovibrio sp.]|nr:aminotransferase class I/II-fold pyridoxal phosphate-dependent enzyme [Vampirovibrio sp.]